MPGAFCEAVALDELATAKCFDIERAEIKPFAILRFDSNRLRQ